MKKLIFLTAIVFLFCGCEANYQLHITESTLNEIISVQTTNEIESNEFAEDIFPFNAFFSDPIAGDYPSKVPGVDYYEIKNEFNNGFLKKTYKYNFNIKRFNDNNAIKTCYESLYVINENNVRSISTSSHFLCMDNFPELEKVTIKVISDFPVEYSNADKIENNNYYWYIDKTNYKNKAIIIGYLENGTENKTEADSKEKVKESPSMVLIVSIILVTVLALFGIMIYNIKQQNHK